MRFLRRKKQNGWTAIKLKSGGLCHVHVERRAGAAPLVTQWHSATLDLASEQGMKAYAEEMGWSRRHCMALLGRYEYLLLQVDALAVPKPEWRQAIRWSIKDMLDYPVADATVDVLEIPGDPGNPSRQRYMYAVVARNEAVRRRIDYFTKLAGSGLEAIDVPELAQRNVAALLEQPGRGLAMLSFDEGGVLLTFTGGGELYHARQFDFTLEQLQSPDAERRTFLFDRAALDLQRSLDNFERQFPYLIINRLVLAPFPKRDELLTHLRNTLYLQVDPLDLAEVFDLALVPELADVRLQSEAFLLLGAALREDAA